MANCDNCNPNCFERVTDDCISIGVDVEGLGIESGKDSLRTALEKAGDVISNLSITESTTEEEVNLGNITIADSIKEVSNKKFTLSIVPGKIDTTVSYNLSEALPTGNTNLISIEAFGNQDGRTSLINRGNSSIGSFKAAPENFPLTLSISVTSINSEGQTQLTFQKALINALADTSERFVIQSSSESINSQKDLNELFDSKIGSLSNQIKDVGNISFNGETGLNDIFVNLQSQIDAVISDEKSDVSELKESISEISKSLSETISSVNDNNNSILTIMADIEIIKSALNI